MIKITDLSLSYNVNSRSPFLVIDGIQLDLSDNTYTSIVGPSGSGKSTLLRCLSGILQPGISTIQLNGRSPSEQLQKNNIGFVFQKPVFFEWKNMLQNVALPAEIAGKSDSLELAKKYLEDFDLADFTNAFPHELSGGMLARAALARALVNNAEFIFLDEAFNNLDEALRDMINDIVQRVFVESKKTVVAVTHDIYEAVFMSDNVVIMNQRPTKVYKMIKIDLPRPRTRDIRMTRDFINIVENIRLYLREVYHQ